MFTDDDEALKMMLRRHAELEELQGDGGQGRFLSGWQCEHPWSQALRDAVAVERDAMHDRAYYYLDEDARVLDGLISFHRRFDGSTPSSVVPAEGGSVLIATVCAWLREHKVDEVFFLPPLYFSAARAFELFGIRARAISGRQPFEPGFTVNLPEQRTVLFLTDPIWYAGLTINDQLIQQIARWQSRTQSLIVIDGSFQYMRWDGSTNEPTSRLDPLHTIRILCPTKTIAIHGYRFAYALMPAHMRSAFLHLYGTLFASATAESVAFARVAVAEMHTRSLTTKLVALIAERYHRLRATGKIAADWSAESGYFVFERLLVPGIDIQALMDGSYFGQKRYPNHRRINLLSPSLTLLSSDNDRGSLVHLDKKPATAMDGRAHRR